MKKQDKRIIATAYVNLIQDKDGNVDKVYGYDINKAEVNLEDIEALQSFLGMLKDKADQDFKDRVDVSEKKYEVGIEDLEEDN